MHAEHAALGQEIVHHGEYRLLDLAGVAGTADDRYALPEVENDEGLAVRVIDLRIRLEVRTVENPELRLEALQGPRVGLVDEHVADEHAVPGGLGDHSKTQAVFGIGADITVLHENVSALQIRLEMYP